MDSVSTIRAATDASASTALQWAEMAGLVSVSEPTDSHFSTSVQWGWGCGMRGLPSLLTYSPHCESGGASVMNGCSKCLAFLKWLINELEGWYTSGEIMNKCGAMVVDQGYITSQFSYYIGHRGCSRQPSVARLLFYWFLWCRQSQQFSRYIMVFTCAAHHNSADSVILCSLCLFFGSYREYLSAKIRLQ